MSMVSRPFAGLGGNLVKLGQTFTGQNFLIGGGITALLLAAKITSGIPEETLLNESTYARRYMKKYREHNRAVAAEAKEQH